MEFRFYPKARQEVKQSTHYYTNIRPQLGRDFRGEVEDAIARILVHPYAWQSLKGNYRRCQIKQFPFGVVYSINEENTLCLIYAVMHLHRKPGYWENRNF